MFKTHSLYAILGALFALYVVWSSTYLAIRYAIETMPPFIMAAARFLIAGGILFAWRRLSGDPMPRRRHWSSAAVVGICLLMGGNGGVVWAEQRIASGIAALLVGATPLWIVMLEMLHRGGRKPGRVAIAGVVVGFAGVAILANPAVSAGERLDPLGVAALLFASLMWAIGSLYSRNAELPESPLLGTAMEMLVGGTGLLVMGSLAGEWQHFDLMAVSLKSAAGLGYLVVFGSLVGFASYTWLLRVAPTILVSTYAYVNPLIAVLLGYSLAQEPLNGRIVVSALVIVSSVALITFTQARERMKWRKA